MYAPVDVAVTHELYCAGAGLALPPTPVITGRSAATVRGVALARTDDPVEALVPADVRVVRTSGLAVRRTAIRPEEWEHWVGLRLATPQRMALDLLLDRPLPDPRAESRPESRVRVWLVPDGLHPQPQHWIEDPRGRLARVDLAVFPQRVAVEYDGGWRNGELWALNRDRERLNRVQAASWEIVFVTASLLRTPDRMTQTVRAALARRVA